MEGESERTTRGGGPAERGPRRRRRAERWCVALVFLAMGAWGGLFVFESSFPHGEHRYFVLFDDAMVSMSFAKNLAAGRGLVWAGNETPVEGFTNPLWTFVMALANLAPLPLRHRSLIVQLLGLALLLATMWRVRSLLCRHFTAGAGSAEDWLPAVVLTGFHYSLAYWSVMGMETPLQALLTVLAVHYAYDMVFDGRDRTLALAVVFALSFLVRMDMLPMCFLVAAWVLAHGGFRGAPPRRLAAAAALCLAVAGGYQLFRWLYFGDVLPNTYYLKMAGVPLHVRLPRGLAHLAAFLRENLVPCLAIAAGFAVGLRRRSRTLLPGLLLLAYLAYSVWVGGDAWELPEVDLRANRFVSFVLPLGFVLTNVLLVRLGRSLAAAPRRALLAATTALLLLLWNGLWLSDRAATNRRLVAFADYPPMVPSHALVLSQLQQFRSLVGDGAEVVTYWAGIPAYFADYRLIDAMGYNDPIVARAPLPADLTWRHYRPGHNKSDPQYVASRRPDAFFQFWDLTRLPVRWPRHHMRWLGYVEVGEFWLRRDSPYLKPGAIPPAAPRSP